MRTLFRRTKSIYNFLPVLIGKSTHQACISTFFRISAFLSNKNLLIGLKLCLLYVFLQLPFSSHFILQYFCLTFMHLFILTLSVNLNTVICFSFNILPFICLLLHLILHLLVLCFVRSFFNYFARLSSLPFIVNKQT